MHLSTFSALRRDREHKEWHWITSAIQIVKSVAQIVRSVDQKVTSVAQ
jgi:hypothetical protein